SGPAASRMDLLTVLLHEFGHVLGYQHAAGDGLMAETLPTGVRRLPASLSAGDGQGAGGEGQIQQATAGTVSQTIGTLPAGKHVTLIFDVTVNAIPPGVTSLSNQAS